MTQLTQEQKYNMLRDAKRSGANLSREDEQFIQDYAMEKLNKTLSKPDTLAVFKRMKDR